MISNRILNESRQSDIYALIWRKDLPQGTGQIIGINIPKDYFDSRVLETTQVPQGNEISEETILDTKAQLEYLKLNLGLNISQLAEILIVRRPAIYDWLAGKITNRSNQRRLDNIFDLFVGWRNLRIGEYFYKQLDGKHSLYAILTEETIDLKLAKNAISKIKLKLSTSHMAMKERQAILDEAGFESISKEQKYKRLKRILRKI